MRKLKIPAFLTDFVMCLLILTFLTTFSLLKTQEMYDYSACSAVVGNPEESAGFRNMYLSEDIFDMIEELKKEKNIDFLEYLSAMVLDNGFYIEDQDTDAANLAYWQQRIKDYKKRDQEAFDTLCDAYETVLKDLTYFPIPVSRLHPKATVSFENSWLYERTYGGSRGHEGTDIMPSKNKAEFYPVISITDGVVEKVGWLDRGGYRIGIRSPHGSYFYYAHLSSYAKDFAVGDKITAGESLGYMGDSGYGPEGTTGMFDVHLHLGIYIKTEHYAELSVNPYWLLKYLKDFRIYYNF